MARGKIQIKRIDNSTNRQVTYSKRRNGLFKKAHELTVLCDAKVSIMMFSSTNRLHEYISPSITTKQVIDDYQKELGIDVWRTHYERMQDTLNKLKEVNRNLRMQIRNRMGESLDGMGFDELLLLHEEMEATVKVIGQRKFKILENQIGTSKKKNRNAQNIHNRLLYKLAREEDPDYGLVDDDCDYDTAIGYDAGGSRSFPLHQQPNHLHCGAAAASNLTTYHLLE